MKITDLHCKEVICLSNGQRLGFVSDVEISWPEGNVLSIIVPGPCKVLGILGRNEDFSIPWKCIQRIGPDIILVDVHPNDCRIPRQRLGFGG